MTTQPRPPFTQSATRTLVIGAVMAASVSLYSQGTPPASVPAQSRDGVAGSRAVGTGTILGRVTDATDGRPLSGVRIQLPSHSGSDVFTGDDGRFTLAALPAASYELAASKAGYLTAWRTGRTLRDYQVDGRSVTLTAGRTEQIDFALSKGGVLAGRVIDDRGREVIGARVSVYRPRWSNGQQQLAVVYATGAEDQTNDLGEFRLFSIPAGSYLLGVRIAKPASEGRITVYYPGTFSTEGAQPLSLRSGEERTVTIALPSASSAAIVGTVRESNGQPPDRARVTAQLVGSSDADQLGTYTGADGTYRFSALIPGEYEISASTTSSRMFATTRVLVDGKDLVVPLTLSAGGIIRGRYRFDTGVPPANVKPSSMDALHVVLPHNDARRTTIGEDWSFTMTGLAGAYRLRPSPPAGWFVKRITRDGRDITYDAVEITGGTIDGIEVLLTQKTTRLSVTIDGTDAELDDTTILLFAEDESRRWQLSPFVRTLRVGQTRAIPNVQWHGRNSFTMSGLPATHYYAVAVTRLEPGRETSPALLRQLAAAGLRVELLDDTTRAVVLKVTEAP